MKALQRHQIKLQQSLVILAEQPSTAELNQAALSVTNGGVSVTPEDRVGWGYDQRENEQKQSLPVRHSAGSVDKSPANNRPAVQSNAHRHHQSNVITDDHRDLATQHADNQLQRLSSKDPMSRDPLHDKPVAGHLERSASVPQYVNTSPINPLDELPHHHNTLSWERTSTLPTNHFISTTSPPLRASLSSTMPSYAGSELPDFASSRQVRLPQDFTQRTDAELQSAHSVYYQNGRHGGSPSHDAMRKMEANTHGRHPTNLASFDDSNGNMYHVTPEIVVKSTAHEQQYANVAHNQEHRLPSPTIPSPTNSNFSTDSMNFDLLQDVFQELSDRKQLQGSSNDRQLLNGSSSTLTSLPPKSPFYTSPPLKRDMKSTTLPSNVLPKNSYDNYTRATLSTDNNARLVVPNNTTAHNQDVSRQRSLSGGTLSSYSDLSDEDSTFTDVTYNTQSEMSQYGGVTAKGKYRFFSGIYLHCSHQSVTPN